MMGAQYTTDMQTQLYLQLHSPDIQDRGFLITDYIY